MPLGEREYRAVLDLVGEANDADGLDELRAAILPTLRRAVPADYASYNEVLEDGRAAFAIVDPELPQWAHEVWAAHALENPLLTRHGRTRDGRAYRWADVGGMREFRHTSLYKGLYKRLGVEHQVAFTLPSPSTITIGVALSRERPAFSQREREMLDLARPHLIQAYRNAQLRDELRGILAALEGGIEATAHGVIVASSGGVVSLASATAVDIVAGLREPALEPGEPLPPRLAAIRRTELLPLDGGDAVLVRRLDGADGRSAVYLLERGGRSLSAEALRGLGLSGREAEVLAAFARGQETEEVAAELGLSVRTVQKHAQAIHSKLGVRRRAQAVATAWAAAGAVEDYAGASPPS